MYLCLTSVHIFISIAVVCFMSLNLAEDSESHCFSQVPLESKTLFISNFNVNLYLYWVLLVFAAMHFII